MRNLSAKQSIQQNVESPSTDRRLKHIQKTTEILVSSN